MRHVKMVVAFYIVAVMFLTYGVVFARASCKDRVGGCCTKKICCENQAIKKCWEKNTPECNDASASCCSECCNMSRGCYFFNNESPWKNLRYSSKNLLMEKITQNQAREMADFFVKWEGNTRLKAGKMVENDNFFEVPIVTKDNSLVKKIKIIKETGCISSDF